MDTGNSIESVPESFVQLFESILEGKTFLSEAGEKWMPVT
jgi:hypothetical protein